jgi:hypothetical protein
LADDLPYRDGAELLDRHYGAAQSDSALIDLARPRLYWTDRDQGDLSAILRADFRTLNHRRADYPLNFLGARYVGFKM